MPYKDPEKQRICNRNSKRKQRLDINYRKIENAKNKEWRKNNINGQRFREIESQKRFRKDNGKWLNRFLRKYNFCVSHNLPRPHRSIEEWKNGRIVRVGREVNGRFIAIKEVY